MKRPGITTGEPFYPSRAMIGWGSKARYHLLNANSETGIDEDDPVTHDHMWKITFMTGKGELMPLI